MGNGVLILSPVTEPAFTASHQVEASCGCICWISAALAGESILNPQLAAMDKVCFHHIPKETLKLIMEKKLPISTVPAVKQELYDLFGRAKVDAAFEELGVKDTNELLNG